MTVSLCDRGVNAQNLHIHARNLFKYSSQVQCLDLSNNPYIDDNAFKRLHTVFSNAVSLETLILDKTTVTMQSISYILNSFS
jgi:hypothetical protein